MLVSLSIFKLLHVIIESLVMRKENNMPTTKGWIAENIRDGQNIDDATYQSIADFCVIWALFEGTELHGIEVAVDELKNVAIRVSPNLQNVQGILDYWKNRYVEEGQTNNRFEHLHLNHAPHRNLVSKVLTEADTNQVNVVHALLLITYRLRNNLFHGVKDITRIRDQIINLNNASEFLKNILLASGRYVFINHA
ncbi:MAG: hypothetical protein ACD_5C00242G0003 [uncultured bacterium]|nr:MAG: hypothetical protein ACD_5C00242G0003 [uncultured bacterium]